MLTELQKTEFDILRHTLTVIDALGLTYYLVCGSALGAVKYSGFIPWDDDVDIALPRKDYDSFCKNAGAALPGHLFIQNYRTDPGFPYIFTKIRNSETTYIERGLSGLNINHGVYIDVFPLDGYPGNISSQRRLERAKLRHQLEYLSCLNTESLSRKIRLFAAFERFIGVPKRTVRNAERFENIISGFPLSGSDLWCNHGNWQGKLEYAPREQYGKGTWSMFEGMRVRVPEKYDEYLTQKYGDWRAELPKEQQTGHHYYVICDVSRPYVDYIKRLPNGKIHVNHPEML